MKIQQHCFLVLKEEENICRMNIVKVEVLNEMIEVSLTKNLAGIMLSGDCNDLDNIIKSLYTITINEHAETKNIKYIDMSTRVLELAYDIRHALQGDRGFEFIDNGMTKEIMKYHNTIASNKNVYYSCSYIFTEMVYCMLAINELIDLKARGKKSVFNKAIQCSK